MRLSPKSRDSGDGVAHTYLAIEKLAFFLSF